jgi:hypothetical protein
MFFFKKYNLDQWFHRRRQKSGDDITSPKLKIKQQKGDKSI